MDVVEQHIYVKIQKINLKILKISIEFFFEYHLILNYKLDLTPTHSLCVLIFYIIKRKFF